MSDITYKAIPVEERLPDARTSGPKVLHVLFDGRLPQTVMFVGFGNGDDWRYLGSQQPVKKGVTHWLELQP